MAKLNNEDLQDEENEEDELQELYGVRDGILFIIDATPSMFDKDPQSDVPYFLQCIRQYKEILKQKLVWNRQDWMGLILLGTEKTDVNSDMQHILVLQKLSLISMDTLTEIMKIDEGKQWEQYRDAASATCYPLHDALWQAARIFSAIDITMAMRKVIFLTCHDNSPMTSDSEKHRIRVKATSYSDMRLQLFVIGFGESWKPEIFYKDLEMLSQNIDADDYKRTTLKDLVEQVKLPSRSMAKLSWRITENVILDVSLYNLTTKTQYLKKENISKETNTALTTCTYLTIAYDDTNVQDKLTDDEDERALSPVLEMDIQKYQIFGGRNIYFTQGEVRSMCTTREPSIDVICMKPLSYHPMYHFGSPYFVMPNKNNRKDNQLLFGALLEKCSIRNLMIICAVTIRKHSATKLFTMIPHARNGGFYLYQIPFRENVRNISAYSSHFIYDNDEKKPPTNPEAIDLLEKIMKRLEFEYNPKQFSNPKLHAQLQMVETLALDLEQQKPVPDSTIPDVDKMSKLAKNLLNKYDEIFGKDAGDGKELPLKKKIKTGNEATDPAALEDEMKIRELVINEQIVSCTVTQLRAMLKTLCLKTTGKKEELISRIKDHFN